MGPPALLLLLAFGPLLASSVRLRSLSGQPEGDRSDEAANRGHWKHQGPSDFESWPLYGSADSKAGLARAIGRPKLPLGKEGFIQRPFDDLVNSICGWKPSPPNESEGWLVVNVSTPVVTPFLVPEDEPGRTDVAVVVVPGGGALELQWEHTGSDVARWLNMLGISAFVLKYRVPAYAWGPEAAMADAQRAVTLVRSRAEALGLNSSRVGVFGASHGAGVALEAASASVRLYKEHDAADKLSYRPDFLLGIYPEAPRQLIAPQGAEPLIFKAARVPPAFLVAVEDDGCVPSGSVLSLYSKLREEGSGAVELHLFPRGRHGFGICVRQPRSLVKSVAVCGWRELAERFLQRTVLQLPAA